MRGWEGNVEKKNIRRYLREKRSAFKRDVSNLIIFVFALDGDECMKQLQRKQLIRVIFSRLYRLLEKFLCEHNSHDDKILSHNEIDLSAFLFLHKNSTSDDSWALISFAS
jgi:hypothetical protein